MTKPVLAALALWLMSGASATVAETPAAHLYRAVTDVCIDRYLSDKDLNAAQLSSGRSLIVQCDCMARFLFPYMDTEASRQLETSIPEKITSNWDDAALKCSGLLAR